MLIRCKKTGEEYEITDREIGEKFFVYARVVPSEHRIVALRARAKEGH